MASEPRSRSARTRSEELVQRRRPVGITKAQRPRVALVPRSTRGYFRITTPWFVIEDAVLARCALMT